ncbi:MAG: family 78 glycoside hydrolase catalytic domain, partial [Phycisphaerae bacterium]|nr:family 78 glycoside hydrolase catalytic domain [Phycisphaerae bacterium]
GTFIVDMGQNFAGWIALRVQGDAGTAVHLRYGELLHPDGTLNGLTSVAGQIKQPGMGGPGAPPTAWQADTYILKGDGVETYRPRFTFHGFRYVEIAGYPGTPTLDAIEGYLLNSDIADAGAFACSNELFNRIQEIVRWTQRSNMFSVQSDCPHRERFSYGGDIIASGEMAMLNFDMAAFYVKTLQDHMDEIRPNGGPTETSPFVGIADHGFGEGSGPIGWSTMVPWLQWKLYTYYGDKQILAEHYDATKRWVRLLETSAVDSIIGHGISDHESLVPKPEALTGTGFYYHNVCLLARIAEVLGRADDVERYTALAGTIRDAFNAKFLQADSGRYGTGTQASQAFALFFDLVPAEKRDAALDVLVRDIVDQHDGHLTTGIFGTKYMLLTLTDLGRADVAYTIANQKTFPGWGHMLEGGATTLWEHWEYSDNVYSHNHPMFGSVSEWFFKALAGIRPDPAAIGFDRILIQPQIVGDLTWARGHYDSIRGRITSEWKLDGNTLTLDVTIPPNTTAKVHVPTNDPSSVQESGKPAKNADGVRQVRTTETESVFAITSGHYRFTTRIRR